MILKKICIVFLAACATAQTAPRRAASPGEQRVARYLDSIRNEPLRLEAFLRRMPKGGDLHNHLSGAIYAESYINYAARDELCVERATLTLVQPPCDEAAGKPSAARALRDGVLHRQLVDAFSMRHFSPATESAHDHFFDTFRRFNAVARTHDAEMLAEVASRAAQQNVWYLELILNLDRGRATELGAKLGWDEDLARLRANVDQNGAAAIVASARKLLDDAEAGMRRALRCDERDRDPGCDVTIRYIYEVYRLMEPAQVFAQAQVGFELVGADPRVVSVNPVQPEDGHVALRDYDLHMRIFDFLRRQHPQVRLTMHAGELGPGLVPPEHLRNHVHDAIGKAGALRIGHGAGIAWEDDFEQTLRQMAQRKIAVEISFSSSDMILGLRGDRHPFPLYMKYGVPIAISTDDEGVARSYLSQEWLTAVQNYKLSYADLKRLARNALDYSFADAATKKQLLTRLDQDFARFEKECCQ